LLIIIAGGAFYGGIAYAKSSTPARGTFAAGGAGGANFAGRGGFGRTGSGSGGFTTGQIVSASNGSISIQQQNGSSTEIVLVSPATQILKTTSGTAADLTTGTNVVITGTSNSDGSMSATSIQIRPAGMQGFGRPTQTQ